MVRGLLAINQMYKVNRDCVHLKQTRSPFPSSSSYKGYRPLELIHGDLCGPIELETLGGSKYFLFFVDNHTSMMWVFILKKKSKALEACNKFEAIAESEKLLKIECLMTNHGGEFNSKEFSDFCLHEGVKRQLSTPYSVGF